MKTIREWFETLPEPHKAQAIKNTHQDQLGDPKPDLYSALKCAFVWAETKQGISYWADITRKYYK